MIKHKSIRLQIEKRSDLYGFSSRSNHLWWWFAHPTAQIWTASVCYSAALIQKDMSLNPAARWRTRRCYTGIWATLFALQLAVNRQEWRRKKTNKPGTPWGVHRACSSLCHAKCMPCILNQWQRSSASSPWQPEFPPWVAVHFSPLTLCSKNTSDLPTKTSLNGSNPPHHHPPWHLSTHVAFL